MTMAAESGWSGECFDEDAPVCENDALRWYVVRARRDLDIAKAFGFRMLEQLAQRLRRIATPPLPGHDGVANVAEAVRRKRLGPGLPAETGASAEFAIPHPHPVSRQTRNAAAIRKDDRFAGSLAIDEAGHKGVRIHRDARQLLLRRLGTEVVSRPAALEGGHVARQVLTRRPDELHGAAGGERLTPHEAN